MEKMPKLNKREKLARLLEGKSAVIFDFDNVIVDSEPYHFMAYQKAFAEEGHSLDREEYWMEWTFRGGGAEGEISRHNLDLDPDYIRSRKDPVYSKFCEGGDIRIYHHALEVIMAFDKMGYTLAIASGSYTRDIMAIIKANRIENLFDAVIGKDLVSRIKPHPETYLKAACSLGIEPSRCVALEDAAKGIISAHGAGMAVIAIETDITRGFDLEDADLIVSSQEELAEMIAALSGRAE